MGTVVSARVTHNNGSVRHFLHPVQMAEVSDEERIELEYAYDPLFLPSVVPSTDGMWRYKALLPVSDDIVYPLAVGGTPLVSLPGLYASMGCASLWLKDETRSPSGSNKDRATALVIEQALHTGVRVVSCASTGNVAVSLAIGAASANLRAVIFVPAQVSPAKLQLMLLSGATVFKVAEGYETAVALSRQAARMFGWYDRNTGYNPLTLEAKKTVAFEIWEQLGRKFPDVVVVPVGDGVTLNGIVKGFRELMLCGVSGRLPRIIGIQAEGCQPLKLAWENHTRVQMSPARTIADGIAVGLPINATLTLRDIKETAGSFLAVTDEAIRQAITYLAEQCGILAEPAAATVIAGLHQALKTGLVKKDECIVALLTGTGLKNPDYLQPGSNSRAYEVSAHIDHLQSVMRELHF
jgi:threonine synthase